MFLVCSVAEMQGGSFLQVDLRCNSCENEQAGLFCVLFFFYPRLFTSHLGIKVEACLISCAQLLLFVPS